LSRETEEDLRESVYERQRSATQIRDLVEKELAAAHIEAQFAWEKGSYRSPNEGCTAAHPSIAMALGLRGGIARWGFPRAIEFQRLLALGLDLAHKARFEIAKVLAQLGYTGDVPMPDISTKEKAQAYIGLDIPQEMVDKQKFQETVVPEWLKQAKENNRLVSLK